MTRGVDSRLRHAGMTGGVDSRLNPAGTTRGVMDSRLKRAEMTEG
jgi:hypothetical protein